MTNLFEKRWFYWSLILLPVVAGLVGGGIGLVYGDEAPPRWATWGTLFFVLTSALVILIAIFEWAKLDRKSVIEDYRRAQQAFVAEAVKRQEEFESSARATLGLLEGEMQRMFQLHEITLKYHDLKGSKELEFFGIVADKLLDGVKSDFLQMAKEREYTLKLTTPTGEYMRNWIDIMAQLMQPNGEVVFVANTVIWSEKYLLAQSSAYAQLNIDSAQKKGLTVKRVLVVPSKEMLEKDPGLLHQVLESLRSYQFSLADVKTGVETRVHRAANEIAYRKHFNPGGEESDNFGIWKSDGFEVCCVVRYREDRRDRYEIESITFTLDRKVIDRKRHTFDVRSGQSEPLDDYVKFLEEIRGGKGSSGPSGDRQAEVVRMPSPPPLPQASASSFADLQGV